MIGVIDIKKLDALSNEQKKAFENLKIVSDLYVIILKDGDCGMQYGRNKYDFEEGVLRFIAPNQVVSSSYGFMLIFYPDLLLNFDLGKNINRYHFFDYSVHEALHLSEKEENTLIEVANHIKEDIKALRLNFINTLMVQKSGSLWGLGGSLDQDYCCTEYELET